MTTEEATTALIGTLVVAKDEDGTVWAGTNCWLVKERVTKDVTPANMSNAIKGPFTNELRRLEHKYAPLLQPGMNGGYLRLYTRPDGKTVRLNDAYMKAIEEMCESEDDEDCVIHPRLMLRQGERRLGMVGVYEEEELVALIAPIRTLNDHIPEGETVG